MKKILITGSNSYIGTSFEKWVMNPRFKGQYQVDTVDMQGMEWREKDFSGYDTVFHVAGIAHADMGKVTKEQKLLYYKVNCDLAVETAMKARKSGVKQFIYMSSIIVYGENLKLWKNRIITKNIMPEPSNFYGDSKREAEKRLEKIQNTNFNIAILRPPMIYGNGSKGNYPLLSKLARKVSVFPDFNNRRSMLYIGNLCEYVRLLVEHGAGGVFFPQNSEYVCTAELVKKIAEYHGRKIHIIKSFNWLIYLISIFPGKVGKMVNKAFGTLIYEKEEQDDFSYNLWDFSHSIEETEKE